FRTCTSARRALHPLPTRRSSDLNVGDMRDENQRSTYFVLKDGDFTAEVAQFLPYVNYRNHADSSYAIGQYEIVKDMLFKQAYSKDRKSTRLNSSHVKISYAVFCL